MIFYICAENELFQSDQTEKAYWKILIFTIVAILVCVIVLVFLLILFCRKYRQRNQKLDINKT